MAKQLSITGFIQGKGRDSGSGDKDASAKAKKRDGDKVYDRTVRNRVWREAWKEDYPWLAYDEAKGLMYCTTCRANTHKRADTTSAYVTGAVCMQTSSIKKHGDSKGHCREEEAIITASNCNASLDECLLDYKNKNYYKELIIPYTNNNIIRYNLFT